MEIISLFPYTSSNLENTAYYLQCTLTICSYLQKIIGITITEFLKSKQCNRKNEC